MRVLLLSLAAGILRKEAAIAFLGTANETNVTNVTIGAATAATTGGLSLPDAVISNATDAVTASTAGVGGIDVKGALAAGSGAMNIDNADLKAVIKKAEKAGLDPADMKVEVEPKKAPLRCELILDVTLDKIHESKGGIEKFGTVAETELAAAAKVDGECIHIMNLRGAYKHRPGAGAFFFVQTRGSYEDVIVDFEILDCGQDMDESFDHVEMALGDDKSKLHASDLGQFLKGATLAKGGAPSKTSVARATVNGSPVLSLVLCLLTLF